MPDRCKRPASAHLLLFTLVGLIAATSAYAEPNSQDEITVDSFESGHADNRTASAGVKLEVVTELGVTDGSHALRVSLPPDSSYAGVRFTPQEPWRCDGLGDYRLSFEATNPGDSSVHLHCDVTAGDGVVVRRSVSVPVGETVTAYFPLTGPESIADHGMRDDPPALAGCGLKMLTSVSKYRADFSRIKSIHFYVNDASQEDVLVLDNLRFASNPPAEPGHLEGIVDRFGQPAKTDYPVKVHSESELRERAESELARLEKGGPLNDRSAFGGWKSGPRLEATGYFRTEKVGDKWALVDPEGYLYFATGIDNLRMANTSTFTGVDFRDPSVRERDPEDVTPEDSLGIAPSSAAARATAYVAYPERRAMFEWLPPYTDPLAKYYGYRRSAHKGPFPHGETFSFYLANLERRYGAEGEGEPLKTWRRVSVDRMLNWGFTSLGNWTDASFYDNDRIPYFANGWIIGDFKTVSSGADYWGPMPDPFDPEFKRRAEATVRVVAEEVRQSPWCVGVFIDNEMAWGNDGSLESHYGIVIHTLKQDAADSPAKAAWVAKLREEYSTIDRLNAAWGVDVASWDDFAAGFTHRLTPGDAELLADYSMLLDMYADAYFKTVHDALEQRLPNHLYLGCRMTPWGMTPESRRAAARYADVMSYNFYREALGEKHWGFLEEIDKPSIIGEFHMGATDAGTPHAGLIQAADQADRGRMFATYMKSVIDNPYFVGAHWFQYIDSPLTGRAHDGENYNIGFVTVTDIPYEPMVNSARDLNASLYERRYGGVAGGGVAGE